MDTQMKNSNSHWYIPLRQMVLILNLWERYVAIRTQLLICPF